MQRFLPLNRHAWKWFLLPGILLVVLLISAFGPATSGSHPPIGSHSSATDGIEIECISSTSSPTDHFRSKTGGFWSNTNTWQSSSDSVTWINATLVPNQLSSSILIWQNNTVQVNSNIAFDQLSIIAGGTLRHESGSITIHNGPGDDLTIFPNGVFQFSGGSWPIFQSASARIRVKTGGIVRVENHIPELAQNLAGNLSSGRFIYESGGIFNWNNTASFVTAGQTYFPDAGPNEMPIFRTSGTSLTIGNSGPTTINGVLDVSGNTAISQSGLKYFRNGIVGSALLTQVPGTGKIVINGDTAVMGGVGVISLQSGTGSNMIETGTNTHLTLLSNKVINSTTASGKLIISGTSTFDTRSFVLSGTAGILLENEITLINAHPDGITGALGTLAGGITIVGPMKQTYIFNRSGNQNSGWSPPLTAGRFIVTNGSKLTLSTGVLINNLEGGYMKIEGSGSQLRANATRAIDIVGSRSFILENGGTMHSSCMEHVNISVIGNEGIGTLNGNGETIRCNSLTSSKLGSGGLTLAPETPLQIRTSLVANYGAAAQFTDNGNTISVGSFLQMTGSTDGSQYNLTGTMIMTGIGAGTTHSYIGSQSSGVIHAELNNLVINSNNGSSYPRFLPTTGNATIKIKGNFIIQNAHPNRAVQLFGNTYHIGGNYSNINQNRLIEATSTLVFDGNQNQTITCPDGEVFTNFEIDKVSGDINLESNLTIAGQGKFTSGLVHAGPHILAFGPNASAIDASQSSYVNGKVRKTGYTAEAPFVFPVGDFMEGAGGWNVFQPAELEIVTTSTTAAFDVRYHHKNFNPIFPLPFNPPTAGMGSVSTCNYWDIDRISGTLPAKVGLSWNEAHCFDVTEPEALLVARYSSIAGDWSEAGSSLGSTHEYLPGPPFTTGWVRTEFPVADFSPFAIGNVGAGNNVLPIELLEFTARVERSRLVMTSWTTLSETNNDFFTVERSANALDWEAVGQVTGAGTSHSLRSYELADDAPVPGRSYYRLKQTDYDGTFAHSEIETVILDGPADLEITHLFRNGHGLELGIQTDQDALAIEIFDLAGKRVLHQRTEHAHAPIILQPNLSQGIYVLRITDSQNTVTRKFFY